MWRYRYKPCQATATRYLKTVLEKSDLDLYTMCMNNKEIKIGEIFLITRPMYNRYWNITLRGATSLLIPFSDGETLSEVKDYIEENYNRLKAKLKSNDKGMSGMASYVEQFGTALE